MDEIAYDEILADGETKTGFSWAFQHCHVDVVFSYLNFCSLGSYFEAKEQKDRRTEGRPSPAAIMLFPAAILFLPLFLALGPADAQSTGDSTCQDVHVFLARGDGEDYPGRIGAIATTVCAGFKNCDYEDITFVSVDGTPYCDSATQGSKSGISQITAYNKKCPDAILVVAGYSLGAHVVGDVLGGGGGNYYNCVEGTISGNLNPNTAPGNMSECDPMIPAMALKTMSQGKYIWYSD